MTLPPVVLDTGTGSVKCGFAGLSPLPLVVCPTVTGRPAVRTTASQPLLFSPASSLHSPEAGTCGTGSPEHLRRTQLLQKEVLCGDELDGLRGAVNVTYPIRNAVIHNMDAMQEVWRYALCQRLPSALATLQQHGHAQDLEPAAVGSGAEDGASPKADPTWLAGRRMLLTEPPNVSLKQRCATMEVFFEEYGLDGIQPTPQGVLALFANGAECGVVVECGEGLSHCTPVFDGFVLTHAQRRMDLGGRAVTDHLGRLLQHASHRERAGIIARSPSFGWRSRSASFEESTLRRLKERYCYVAVEPTAEAQLARETNALQRTCTLPDGALCRLNAERYTASEVLFTPSLMDYECDGLSQVLWSCLEAADIDVRAALYETIVVSGGTTLLPGFGARLERDAKQLYLTTKLKGDAARLARCPIRVKEPPRREYMVYVGGALVADMTANQPEMWMSRQEYEEGGSGGIAARYHASH